MLPSTIGPVKKAALSKVPYIRFIPEDGRTISLLPYYDEKEKAFKQPFPKESEIIFLKGKPEQGPYYARAVLDRSRDILLELADFVTKYCSFPSTMEILLGVERDVLNCSAIVEKYFLFLDLFHRRKDAMIANLVMTDVEFLFSNVRSLYDSFQMLAKDVLKQTKTKTSRNLPNSYFDIAKLEKEEMRRKYDLSEPRARPEQFWHDLVLTFPESERAIM